MTDLPRHTREDVERLYAERRISPIEYAVELSKIRRAAKPEKQP